MKFSISTLLLVTVIVAVIMAVANSGPVLGIGLIIIVVNLIGVLAGHFITKTLNFPTDGGYRNPEARAEFEKEQQIKMEKQKSE